MKVEYSPKGVCSRKMIVDVEDGVVRSVQVEGGCNGNLQGICSLVKGMNVDDVIEKLEGLNCNGKGTSCPDQLAKALKSARG